ncbi:MAG: hypothetical protein L0H96_01040 [Humibacillus sp.]|nr:hypothetical protein [Humibacillus sp.]MDN5775482.1 hypothetical protein [Humibacillus sp.]
MTTTPPTVSDKQRVRLLGQLWERAMVELTTEVGLANLYAHSNVSIGIESRAHDSVCQPDSARSQVA